MAAPTPANSISLVERKLAADTAALVTNGVPSFPEDPFAGSYSTQGATAGVCILEPTFNPAVLRALTTRNNILAQCIEIMEVNIDGTGFTIEHIEGTPENEVEKKMLQSFFDEPYPSRSMVSIRRDLRADLESTGLGYLECIRNLEGKLLMFTHLFSSDMRLIRYDDPVLATKTIQRDGKDLAVTVRTRERRFVQIINAKKTYFKEFEASRELNRNTGEWAPEGTKLAVADRASEVLYFTLTKEAATPYAVPRWINQLPSILGSRKAEEFNLEFFDSGGLPPMMVVVQGGYLGDGVKEQLLSHLSGKGSKHRAAIIEAISSSGSLDSSGSVKVTVERFGTERQQDAMFQQYDKNCEDHVRVAFRLPPLFTGRSTDYTLATARTSYQIAEAQVFAPERLEFDERMWWLCKALGAKSYTLRSKPLTITDIDSQLKAMGIGIDANFIDKEKAVSTLNTLTGMVLEYSKPPEPPAMIPGVAPSAGGANPATSPEQPAAPPAEVVPPANVLKSQENARIADLAERWASALGLSGECDLSEHQIEVVKADVANLTPEGQKVFNAALAEFSLLSVGEDAEGIAELCGCVARLGEF